MLAISPSLGPKGRLRLSPALEQGAELLLRHLPYEALPDRDIFAPAGGFFDIARLFSVIAVGCKANDKEPFFLTILRGSCSL